MKAHDRIFKIEWLIRDGRGDLAEASLEELISESVPREHAAAIARLARRGNVPKLGLQVLYPIVRPAPRVPCDATPAETAEYAACLIRIGALEDAYGLLCGIDEKAVPRVLLYKTLFLVARWNYRETISLMTRFIESDQIDRYDRMVGKVNLAAALLYEGQIGKAEPILKELLYQASLRRYNLVLARTLELVAELWIVRRKWDQALAFLEEAERRLEKSHGIDELVIKRYFVLVDYLRTGGDAASASRLSLLRREAEKREQWETVRACDRHVAALTKDRALLAHLYFGTPFPYYRERLVSDLGIPPEGIGREYVLKLGGSSPSPPTLDLFTGEWEAAAPRVRARLAPGSIPHRLLVALASDFYHPARMASLHARVYPGDHYSPFASPPRLYDAMNRLRRWCRANGVPLVISESNGAYRLGASAPIALRFSEREGLGMKDGPILEQLKRAWPESLFSTQNAAELLSLSTSTVHRFLHRAIEARRIERVGKASTSVYRFLPS